MPNCKPGDMAVVTRCPEFPENIGAIVRVVGPPECRYLSGLCWCVVTTGRPLAGFLVVTGRMGRAMSNRCDCPDEFLRPLPGDLHEDTEPAGATLPPVPVAA